MSEKLELRAVEYQKVDGVATITKNRPPYNFCNRRMLFEIEWCLRDCGADDAVRVVLLDARGEGGGWHGGAELFHIMERGPASPQVMKEVARRGREVIGLIEDLPKPVIGVVRGGARGGGGETLAACDFVIASTEAKFWHGEVDIGVTPGWGGTQRVARLVGRRRAARLILDCEIIDAVEAERIGLITRAVPKPEVDAEVAKLVARLKSRPALVVAQAKNMLKVARESSLAVGLAAEAEAFNLTAMDKACQDKWNGYWVIHPAMLEAHKRTHVSEDDW